MSKSFSEHERSTINQKLIQSCEECWSRYGYKKTSVGEISQMAGISTGAFYLFYKSKEMLFIETAQLVSDRFFSILEKDIPPQPTKHDFAKAIKLMTKELENADWFLSLSDEFEMLSRKLPPNYLEQVQIKDVSNFSQVIEKYHLTPKFNTEKMTVILRALIMMLHSKKLVGKGFNSAFEFILDNTIETLFE